MKCEIIHSAPRKHSGTRQRYIKHRRTARTLERKDELRRIAKGNELLRQKIDNIKNEKKSEQRLALKTPKRVENPIKKQQLIVSNISFLRRILKAKPFCTRDEWLKQRKEAKSILRRLQEARNEREDIIGRRELITQGENPAHVMSCHFKRPKPPGSPKKTVSSPKNSRPKSPIKYLVRTGEPLSFLSIYEKQAKKRRQQAQNKQNINSLDSSHFSHVENELLLLENQLSNLFEVQLSKHSSAKGSPPQSPARHSPRTSKLLRDISTGNSITIQGMKNIKKKKKRNKKTKPKPATQRAIDQPSAYTISSNHSKHLEWQEDQSEGLKEEAHIHQSKLLQEEAHIPTDQFMDLKEDSKLHVDGSNQLEKESKLPVDHSKHLKNESKSLVDQSSNLEDGPKLPVDRPKHFNEESVEQLENLEDDESKLPKHLQEDSKLPADMSKDLQEASKLPVNPSKKEQKRTRIENSKIVKRQASNLVSAVLERAVENVFK